MPVTPPSVRGIPDRQDGYLSIMISGMSWHFLHHYLLLARESISNLQMAMMFVSVNIVVGISFQISDPIHLLDPFAVLLSPAIMIMDSGDGHPHLCGVAHRRRERVTRM